MTQQNSAPAAVPPSLTLDSALGLLSGSREDELDGHSTSTGESSKTGDAPIENTTSTQPNDRASVGQAVNEAGEGVQPPASWRASDRELFRSLPVALQERIAAREQQRERAVNEALRQSAALRQAAEGERAAFEGERQRFRNQLDALIMNAQHELASEFADIRTPADLVALAQKDPARYAVLRARQDALQHAQAEQMQLQARAAEQQSAQLRTVIEQEKRALIEKRPELKDKAARARLAKELREYATSVGYTPEQFDSNLSHVNLLVLEKAMLYDRAQQARTEAMSRRVPRVQMPGTAVTKGERASEARAARLNRLERTGRIEDAVGLLRI